MPSQSMPGVPDDGLPVPAVVTDWVDGLEHRFLKTRILRQADHEPIYGTGVTQILQQRGCRLPPGTVYAMLQALEAAGLLECRARVVHGKRRKYYRATFRGRRVLARAREHLVALHAELIQG